VVFEFGPFSLDDDRRALEGPEGPVNVEPQVFEVLRYLLVHRQRVVPKEELLDAVWGDRFVSESALSSRIKSARQAIADDGKQQRCIKTLHGHGYRFVAPVTVRLDAVAPTPAGVDRHLPIMRTTMIGRDEDLIGVIETMRRSRATTITGPGGVGKTTLALAAAHHVEARYPDGAVFVDLAPTSSVDDVTRALADAAGVEGDASRSMERLASHLASRRVLVLLDNCEHVLPAASHVADLLLSGGSEVQLLVTTREPLGVQGEHLWPLDPLTSAAPELFAERARQAEPRVAWRPDDPAIIELCQRLDGLPLALELAAGQLRRLSFAELSRELEGRLTLLSRSAQRSALRHGTMSAAIDWSYQLLEGHERRLLRHLSIFPAWFGLHDAQALAPQLAGVVVPNILGELVDKSLVIHDPGTGRYRLLETIRVYTREKLEQEGEAEAGFECHRRHVVEQVRACSRLDRWMSARLAATYRTDLEHARQAFWSSLAADEPADAVELAIGRAFLWRNAIGCTEGELWVDELDRHKLVDRDRMWLGILRADVGQGVGDHRAMVAGAVAAGRADDGADPEATCVAAHYASLMHLTGGASSRERLGEVLAMAGEARLRNLMEAFLVAADLADGSAADIDARVERLRHEASADGYDRFILHWAAWMHGLVRRDAGFARRWMDLQQEFLDRTGIVETWITTFSSAMTDAVDGSDVREQLARALALADREGYRAEGDCALALAFSEACRGNGLAAAELLGTAVQSRFNSTAHYVLYRLVVEPVVRAAVPPTELAAALERGQRRSAAEALAQHGIGS
jgi:predicted ATPase/DNA-binding winged helix-turn-helix (wHTH) protein